MEQRPPVKPDLSVIRERCEVVQEMLKTGSFNLDEFALHIATCATCQRIQTQVTSQIKHAITEHTA